MTLSYPLTKEEILANYEKDDAMGIETEKYIAEVKARNQEYYKDHPTLNAGGLCNYYFKFLESKMLVVEQMILGEFTLSHDVFCCSDIVASMALDQIVLDIERLYTHFFDTPSSSQEKFIKVLAEQGGDDAYSLFNPLVILQELNKLKEKGKNTNTTLYSFCEENKDRFISLVELTKLNLSEEILKNLKNKCSVAGIIYKEIRCFVAHKGSHSFGIKIQNVIIDKMKLLEIYKHIMKKLIDLSDSEKKELYKRLSP